ncbi:Oxidoreductase andH, partial [Lachnellula cervina]
MVSLTEVQASNARIASCLPPGLVAVFVGATSGIGETSLKQFAKHCSAPRIYFIGRSQEAGDRIAAELKSLNAEGRYTFIKADVSLIRVVDDVCREIKSKETAINLLVMSQGTFVLGTETTEGLHMAMSLSLYSRTRFTLNLLPHLRSAPRLRRVITVLGAGYE